MSHVYRLGARVNRIQRSITEEFHKAAGRHDDPAVFGGPAGDAGLIGPDSISWEINADLASVSQAGIPAIVLEILHPSVVAGVQDLSNYRQDPSQRARATLRYVRPPLAMRPLIGPMLQLDARRLRWAMGTPRFLELARQRVAGASIEPSVA
jgi:hypothetical protein